MSFEITPKTSWAEIEQESSITQVIHPLYDNYMTKEEFAQEFGAILPEFNGQDDYPDSYLGFYVEVNPINGALKFTDEDTKADFIEYAIEEGLIPPLKEVHQGEGSDDRKERMEREEWEGMTRLDSTEVRDIEREILQQQERERLASMEIQRQKSFDRSQSHSQFYKDYMLLENIWKGCQKNIDKINKINNSGDRDPDSYARIAKKLEGSRARLEPVYHKFATNYPPSEFHIYPDYNKTMNTVIQEIGNWLMGV